MIPLGCDHHTDRTDLMKSRRLISAFSQMLVEFKDRVSDLTDLMKSRRLISAFSQMLVATHSTSTILSLLPLALTWKLFLKTLLFSADLDMCERISPRTINLQALEKNKVLWELNSFVPVRNTFVNLIWITIFRFCRNDMCWIYKRTSKIAET